MVKKRDPLLAGLCDSDRRFSSDSLALAVRRALRPGLPVLAVTTLGAVGALVPLTAAHAEDTTGPTATSSHSDSPEADSSNELDETIIVSARRMALKDADDRKKNSESLIDSVVADEAGLLPDNSVTEVLQRVAGVTMVRFSALNDPDHYSAEGSGIQVRGLSGVDARLNGREVFSANTGQGLSFGDVTPELLAAVDVYKSATADLIEGGSGGQVDLRTHMPFDFQPGVQFQATVNGNYGDLAKKADPGASFLLSDHWVGPWGDFGALVDIAYSKLDQKDFFIRNEPYYRTAIGGTDYYIPGGFDYGFDQFARTRTGEYAALQWAPTDNLQVGQTFFFSEYQTKGPGNGVFVTSKVLAVDPINSRFDSSNGLISSPNVFTRNTGTFSTTGAPSMYASGDSAANQSYSDTLDASTTVHWKPAEHWDLKGAFQFVNSVTDTKSYNLYDTPPTGDGNYSLSETADQPSIGFPSSVLAQYKDPANYVWSAHMDHRDHHDGEEHAGNVDVAYDISDRGFFRTAQVGARYADRTEQDADDGYNWSGFCKGWNGCSPVSLAGAQTQPGDFFYQGWSDFFHGAINNPGGVILPSYALASQWNPSGNVAQFGGTLGAQTNPDKTTIRAFTFGPEEVSQERSSNTAVYGLIRFENDSAVRFDGNFGVRYVKIDNKSQGYFQQNAVIAAGTTVYPSQYYLRSGGRDVSRALPAFNIRFKATDQLFIRGAYTITLDEPSFYDLRANGNATATVNTATVNGQPTVTSITYATTAGNPTLHPTISHNSDLALEWYPSASTSAHLSLFYKTLNDTIVYGNTLRPVPYVTAGGTTVTELASVQADFNAPQTATIKGLELGGRTFFDRLPSPFNGFGLEGNLTHLNDNSPGNQYVDINGLQHNNTPLIGLSNNSWNAAFMFEKPQWSVRLAYNWRSKYLMTTNSNGTNGSYTYYSAPGVNGQIIGISLPIYAAAYGQLDFGAAYRPTQHLTFSIDLDNLTNSQTKTIMGGYNNGASYVRSWFVADRRIMLSMRFRL